jgi:ATP-binding cassette subfamily C protein CydC
MSEPEARRSAETASGGAAASGTRAVLRLAQPRARWFLPGLAAGVLSAASAVALLATSAWLITRAAEQPPILYLSVAVVGVRAFALGRSAFRYLERLASHDAAFRQLAELRLGIFARLVPLAPAGLVNTGRGDLLARLVRDVDDLQDLPLRVVQPLATAGIVSVLSVVGVWLVLPAAGLTLAACLLLAGVLGTLAAGALAARSERALAPLRGALAGEVLEVVENLDVLTAFGALDGRLASLGRADDSLRRAALRRALGSGLQAAVTSLLAGAATILALVAGIPALHGTSGLNGPALAVIVLVPMAVFEVFGAIPSALGAWRQVRSSAERVWSAVPTPTPPQIPTEAVAATDAGGPRIIDLAAPVLELDGVGATWPGADAPAVSGVTLRLGPGDRVHLAGPSGSSTTTAPTGSTASRPGSCRWPRCGAWSGSASSARGCSTTASARICSSPGTAPATRSSAPCWTGWAWPSGPSSAADWMPGWANGARSCPVARLSASRWPAPCWPGSRCSSSTNRRRTSTRRRATGWCGTSWRPPRRRGVRCCSSRTLRFRTSW